MKISEFALNRPVTMVMVTLSMLILGGISLTRLPLEQLPSISSSSVSVSVSYPSSSPEETELNIAIPLEEILSTLSNIEQISSRASNDGAIDLSGVTNVSGPTYETHDRIEFIMESGGTINLDNLATTGSGNGKVRFDIRDAPGGVFSLPALQTSDDAEFIVATGLTANLGTTAAPPREG